jgi:phenylalanyl-tRNA synthetase beta chain
MKFSEQWLRKWVDPDISTEEMCEQLTMAGLEVDGVEPAAGKFTNVIVACVESMEKHPDADKLNVCQVTDGMETFQVVCGASNVREGLMVPLAKIGAVLPGDFKIKPAKLRGVESFGMLCSEKELGLADQSEGLLELSQDAPMGRGLEDYLRLDDDCIEIDLTPNRGDCLSIAGIARELGTLNECDVSEIEPKAVADTVEDSFPVEITADKACTHYVGRVVWVQWLISLITLCSSLVNQCTRLILERLKVVSRSDLLKITRK